MNPVNMPATERGKEELEASAGAAQGWQQESQNKQKDGKLKTSSSQRCTWDASCLQGTRWVCNPRAPEFQQRRVAHWPPKRTGLTPLQARALSS